MRSATVTSVFLSSFLHSAYGATLAEVISSKAELSAFNEITKANPALLDLIINGEGGKAKTVFIPNNDAFGQSDIAKLEPTTQQAILRYHVLNGTFKAEEMSVKGGRTLGTYLEGDQFVLLGGTPNVVFASKFGDSGIGTTAGEYLQLYTGLGAASNVEEADVEFDGGTLHIVDKVFTLPATCSKTAENAKLTSLLAALEKTNLTTTLDTTDRITCFAPSDEAFKSAGNPENALNKDQLSDALKFHTLQGDFVGYSDSFEFGKAYKTLNGDEIIFRRDDNDGTLWVNDVKVLKANVITKNGVAHVLEGVLTPTRKNNGNDTSPTGTSTGEPTSTPTQASASVVNVSYRIMAALMGAISISML